MFQAWMQFTVTHMLPIPTRTTEGASSNIFYILFYSFLFEHLLERKLMLTNSLGFQITVTHT